MEAGADGEDTKGLLTGLPSLTCSSCFPVGRWIASVKSCLDKEKMMKIYSKKKI